MAATEARAAVETIVLDSGAGLSPEQSVPNITNVHGLRDVSLSAAAFTPSDFLAAINGPVAARTGDSK
jgi:hypothetical protein